MHFELPYVCMFIYVYILNIPVRLFCMENIAASEKNNEFIQF